jgi:hypothetical protein
VPEAFVLNAHLIPVGTSPLSSIEDCMVDKDFSTWESRLLIPIRGAFVVVVVVAVVVVVVVVLAFIPLGEQKAKSILGS